MSKNAATFAGHRLLLVAVTTADDRARVRRASRYVDNGLPMEQQDRAVRGGEGGP